MISTYRFSMLQGIALVVSFLFIFFTTGIALEAMLSPWDTTPLELRTPLTDPARQWNDFFESGFGARLLVLPFFILLIAGIARLIFAKQDRHEVATEMFLAHVIFFLVWIGCGLLLSLLVTPASTPAYSPIHIGAFALLFIGLIALQSGGLMAIKRFCCTSRNV